MADRIRTNRLGAAAYGGARREQQLRRRRRGLHTGADGRARFIPLAGRRSRRCFRTASAPCQYAGGVPPTYTIQVTWQEVGLPPLTYQTVIQVPDL